MIRIILACLALLAWSAASPAAAQEGPLQAVLQTNASEVERASRRSVGEVLEALAETGSPQLRAFLEAWSDRRIVMRDEDGLFFFGERDGDIYRLSDIDTGEPAGEVGRREATELRPNAGVRRVIGAALVRFQLTDPTARVRREAVEALERAPSAELLEILRASIEEEEVPSLRAFKQAAERRLTARFDTDPAARIAAIEDLSGSIRIEDRAALSRVLTTRRIVAENGEAPDGANVAARLRPGQDIGTEDAYSLLVEADLVPPRVTREARDAALVAAISEGAVAGFPVAQLDDEQTRWDAYDALARLDAAPARLTDDGIAEALETHAILDLYVEEDSAITDAARASMDAVEGRLALHQTADLGLDALSLASIYFLAAIGLAVTFGVMGVINMAHGEFIMIGAYTGYVVQLFVPDYTLSLVIALPLAFCTAGLAGVALERLVIRHLMHRPLETLLATFGISVALQQIAKNVFGTQARPLTSPDWLAGSWQISEVISVSWIRVAIFVLALIFLAAIVYVLRRTRLGLEVRAVTQNPGMAASMGIDPGRIGMLTFGLGSGIAGVAGVAIGLYAQVTSEMGAGYIVQSFMTVVVGGVGSVFGTLAGAGLIGGLQKGIEWLNPSNTLAAQTFMILFIIAFIQFRPRGIVPQKGRAAGG
ncbi:urea ABC transporter permease subunit UrtB [Jannaschia aquimarina]|uniref:LivH_1 protein n=1 Tax=Jannaschia aquimarina TaxID=935700 RepID=A0A0D1CRM4_9RHOB|nr:urea ABC transporter permease subunit UrtB [Jannaschia aquimarina]KIT17437.1 High-affinity branched-chain amino acid transport system permease protein LivH [Jannaschia aquimarina]SNS76114.1 amino acid/amide ABC transporter membrane protein 1, HAAT family [Jannaschia aquimarina]